MRGIVSKARFVALFAIMCLAAAPATTQARIRDTSTCIKVGIATVCPTLNTVKVSFTMPTKTTANVSTSVDKSFGLTVLDGKKKMHSITIPESPATTYNIKIVITPVKGKSHTFAGSFTTGAVGSVPAAVTKQGNKLALNGVKTFLTIAPVNNGCMDQATASGDIGLGVMVLSSSACLNPSDPATSVQLLASWLAGKLWWRELDASNAAKMTGMPTLITWSTGILGAGVFPALTPCASPTKLSEWITSQAALIKSAASKGAEVPVTWVAGQLTDSLANCLNSDPEWLNAFFWTAVANGAAGISYDTHQLVHGGNVPNFSVVPSVQNQIIKQDNCMKTVGTAMMNGKPVAVAGGSGLQAQGWIYGGVTYIDAVNPAITASTATLSAPGLSKIATVQRICETSKTLKVRGGSFTDSFGSAGVHLYKAVPGPLTKKK